VPQTSIQFKNALRFYKQRQDKSWGLTDCASILIMQAEGINEALAYDVNFKQAGFTALLRDD
jgi:predicted nucleic acid-binding protein